MNGDFHVSHIGNGSPVGGDTRCPESEFVSPLKVLFRLGTADEPACLGILFRDGHDGTVQGNLDNFDGLRIAEPNAQVRTGKPSALGCYRKIIADRQ